MEPWLEKISKKKELIESKLAALPAKAGVYMMRDSGEKILYVGKAKNLANRVRSYFRGEPANPKIAALVRRVCDLEYIVTDNEAEALILESNLIKEHRPRYNVNLKDDKLYPYLKVTVNEPFPRAFVTRRYERDGARYFGPYTSAGALRTTLEVLRKVFPLRNCNYSLPGKRGPRECLNFYLGKCSGPCHGHISQEEYRKLINEVLQFLDGKTAGIEKRIAGRMKRASASLDYELAARCRNQLAAVQKVSQRQKMHAIGGQDEDVLALSIDGSDACAIILKVRGGKLVGSEHHYLKNTMVEPPSKVLGAFINQNYLSDREYPGQVYLSQDIEDRDLVEAILTERTGRRVRLHVPERGAKAGLVSMAERNSHLLLEELIMRKEQARQRVPEALLSLQKTLALPRLPRLMVCFDISTIQGSYAVAAMSCFRNGKPQKSGYRRFRIRSVDGQDDFRMMGEAVGRYFNHVAKGELEMPQLVVIDGGKGQLNAACEAINKVGLDIPSIAALAKKEEELYLPGKKEALALSRRSEAMRLLQRLRDESHRFAVSYHRGVRKKETLKTRLEEIAGVGPVRSRALIEAFGSAAAVARAGKEQLAAVQGISPALAVKIIEHLKKRND
ncbi:MAG TPA: excinuclease ABC subunit UvrC [archaeon]|nr:excinuclease ABC subunit UvrC [archaeon]